MGLALVIANLPQPVIIADKQGRICYVNDYACQLLGFTAEELLRSELSAIVTARHHKKLSQAITELLQDQSVTQNKILALIAINKNSEQIPARSVIAKLPSNAGEMHLLICLSENSLNTVSNYLNVVQLTSTVLGDDIMGALDTLEDPIVIFDQDWNYVFVNQVGWRILDRKKSAVLGHNVWKLMPHLQGSKYQKSALRAKASQQRIQIEEYYPDYQRWYRTIFYPSKHTLVSHMKDITETVSVKQINSQLTGTLEQAMEVYWSKNNLTKHKK